jgi:hypothetical protein
LRIHAVLALFRRLRHVHLRALAVAVIATALTAGLAFAGAPPEAAGPGLAKAAAHANKVVPVRAGQEAVAAQDEDAEADIDAEADEDTEADETDEAAGDNCATDPTGLTDEELAAMRHGSIVCWAAHQDSWPEEFKNHGQWVSSWAHWKAPDASVEGAAASGKANGKANGKAKNP